MANSKYQRIFEELSDISSKFFPSELSDCEVFIKGISLLFESQDKFIAILGIGESDTDSLFKLIDASGIAANLFLKHLALLSYNSEQILNNINNEFISLFPDGILHYHINNHHQSYKFRALPQERLDYSALHIDDKQLLKRFDLDDLKRDVIALLMYGGVNSYKDDHVSILEKCILGKFVGRPAILAQYCRTHSAWGMVTYIGQLLSKWEKSQPPERKTCFPLQSCLSFYEEAIPFMTNRGEQDWCYAARTTKQTLLMRKDIKFFQYMTNLARECHADLQGYVQKRFDLNINISDIGTFDVFNCVHLYWLSDRLIEIGGKA